MAAMLAATATLGPASELRFAGRKVLLGDVARVKGPGAERLRQIVVARLTAASARQVSRPALAGLIRRAVPGLRVTGKGPENVTLISLAPRADSLQGPCFEARNAIAGGAAIHAEDAAPVTCDQKRKSAAIVEDPATGEALAASPIAAGDYLGRVRLAAGPQVRTGERLTLVSSAGPVTIRRGVTALQPGKRNDRRLFVAASDGSVFSAPLALKDGQ